MPLNSLAATYKQQNSERDSEKESERVSERERDHLTHCFLLCTQVCCSRVSQAFSLILGPFGWSVPSLSTLSSLHG